MSPTRRDFLKATGAIAAARGLRRRARRAAGRQAPLRHRRHRHPRHRMWGRRSPGAIADVVEFVGLCDINPKRVEAGHARASACRARPSPSFDEMCDKAKPDAVMVSTVDAYHENTSSTRSKRGIQVITEKPMVTDEAQCQAVLDAEKRNGHEDRRHLQLPLHPEVPGDQGGRSRPARSARSSRRLQLVPRHPPRRRLLPPLAPPAREERHAAGPQGDAPLRPDQLVLDADPVEVAARGGLEHYGKNEPVPRTPSAGGARTRRSASSTGTSSKDARQREALRRLRVRRRLHPRRLRVPARTSTSTTR